MNEADWLACHNPWKLLLHLKGAWSQRLLTWMGLSTGVSARKLRLFACACSRHYPTSADHLTEVIDAAERYADRLGTLAELEAADREIRPLELWAFPPYFPETVGCWARVGTSLAQHPTVS